MTKNRNNLPALEAFFWIGVILALAGFLFWLIAPSRAQAQERGWLPGTWERHIYLYRDHRPRRRRPESYYRSAESSSLQPRCFGRVFSDKGREFASEEAALKDAERSWGALVREEPGEKWMDLKFAERYESRCQRSSTGESATAKVVGGITETFTGKDFTILYRCRIWAEPCTAPKTSDGGKDR